MTPISYQFCSFISIHATSSTVLCINGECVKERYYPKLASSSYEYMDISQYHHIGRAFERYIEFDSSKLHCNVNYL